MVEKVRNLKKALFVDDNCLRDYCKELFYHILVIRSSEELISVQGGAKMSVRACLCHCPHPDHAKIIAGP